MLRSPFLLLLVVHSVYDATSAHWVFETAGNAVASIGQAMNTVAGHVDKVVTGVKFLENFISEAIEEDCDYYCPNGAKPISNPEHKTIPNGCGTFGMEWKKGDLPLEELSECCDEHDICYDTCNEDKENCDRTFKKCLYNVCNTRKGEGAHLVTQCKLAAKVMFTGTIALGCKAYKEAQSQACTCPPKRRKVDL